MATERPLVVVADPIDRAALDALRESCEVEDVSSEPGALAHALSRAWALVVRSRTKVTSELLEKAPRLRLIARAGVGVDNIDVAAATRKRIRVVNAPTAATTSVAELTVALMLLLVRGLAVEIAATRAGAWKRGGNRSELAGKTVGFVGYGRIAREAARRLGPFGVSTLAYDPFVREAGDGTALVPLDELLARSDIVSLHAALTPENRHLMDAGRFARMKPGSFLVNVARGALVDERALWEALEQGPLAGAALDVLETEPPADPKLLAHPKVIATPHVGASTHEAQARAGAQVVSEVLRAVRGEKLASLVNPEAEATA